MKKRGKIIGIIVLIVWSILHFVRPQKNVQTKILKNDFLIHHRAPQPIQDLFKNSCYNCHSNYTVYPWYDNIVPAAWYVDNHISNAKEQLNFSEWATLDAQHKNRMIAAIAFNVTQGKMPLPSYVFMHPEAKLSDDDKNTILEWLYEVDIN